MQQKCGYARKDISADKSAISLRWHDPNQVTGQGNTAHSQPALCGLPFYTRKHTTIGEKMQENFADAAKAFTPWGKAFKAVSASAKIRSRCYFIHPVRCGCCPVPICSAAQRPAWCGLRTHWRSAHFPGQRSPRPQGLRRRGCRRRNGCRARPATFPAQRNQSRGRWRC